jgi:hypothetical protein
MLRIVVVFLIGSLLWQPSMRRSPMEQIAPGELTAEVKVTLDPGTYVSSDNPSCGDPRFDGGRIPMDLKQTASSKYRAAGVYALGLQDPEAATVTRPPAAKSGIGQYVRKPSGLDRANCGRLLIVMPKAARVTRIVKDSKCPAGGWCGFAGEPVTEEIDATLFGVSVVFKNWSHTQEASATLRVFYRQFALSK